ncbi:WRKY transcription factor 55 [Mercurialis annua]|uniref:WRKY transcription factor 55 n=1 Tax=Mercurialis annua TaxID=3986 RepID=UPI00215FFB91|nr:WRKY transcription factor 55 [Mercurialis annua]
MDDFISSLLRGIKLAKDLEPTLQNLATRPDMLSKLDEIIRVFMAAKETLNAVEPSLYNQVLLQQQEPNQIYKTMMELLLTQGTFPAGRTRSEHIVSSSGGGLAMELGGSTDVQTMAPSSLHRTRRRKDDADRRTIRVAAPRMGNTEIPPEDGYTWRKYGQKEILASKYPRGYYRCTHQKLYQCPAKKQVQRLDDDPSTFEVMYRGDHTCHMSATAPSILMPAMTQEMTQTMAAGHHSLPWLEFSLGGGASSGSGAGPSTVRYGKEAEYPVADMADVMFNSGSSSSNSMELIFTSLEEHNKWDQGDKKN